MSRQDRIGSHATTISRDVNGYTSVIYHTTPVVRFNHNEIILNSGGWLTPTTKTRMNQASNEYGLGYEVFQKDYDWYVRYRGKTKLFHDGIRLPR